MDLEGWFDELTEREDSWHKKRYQDRSRGLDGENK